MVRRHRRYELLDVMLDGAPLPNATLDVWEDASGPVSWVARLMAKASHPRYDGLVLTGRTREGRAVRGQVQVCVDSIESSGGRMVVVELVGRGPLDAGEERN